MNKCGGDVTAMAKQIEQEYYEWLISQVEIRGDKTFRELFERMHNTEFVWMVARDDNRVADGLDLRIEFLNNHPGRKQNLLILEGASFLEVLIALSRRTAFTAGGEASAWAWMLIENLRLDRMADPLSEHKMDRIDAVLEDVIWRQYEWDGTGGFFPLVQATQDQTKVEIWYQMQAYVIEIQEP